MENYFNYFTEVEMHFCQRRGRGLQVSPLDWELIGTWKDAGIPLEAVLRGIDSTFDRYDRRPSKTKKVNGLAYCSQEILAAAEEMKEAAVGASREQPNAAPGMQAGEIEKFFRENAQKLRQAEVPATVKAVAEDCANTLENLAEDFKMPARLEDMERHLTVLEEKLLAALTISASESDLIRIRAEADREIAPYRSKMPAVQIEQLMKRFIHRRLFEQFKIPRLSLFYL
ncbi:MAG: hypothetical protein DMG65_08340 [Candidatus Angelobacter sp. Gp1-AA117]|nr:MAG: hypothetical protein DMG65_08340 [Candidatus Angelobacter sp. Gp1-AA117]